jgi:hypothetical protein
MAGLMAQHFTFALEDKENPIGSPAFVLVDVTELPIGANTWGTIERFG